MALTDRHPPERARHWRATRHTARRSTGDPYEIQSLAPDEPLYVVGDVHGRFDLAEPLMERLIGTQHHEGGRIVLLGDYIDRGPDSASVLTLLANLQAAGCPVTCLMGNHEAMLLDFLATPTTASAWLAHGGQTTVKSYGIEARERGATTPAAIRELAVALREAIPANTLAFLKSLKPSFQSGNVFASHAGASPWKALSAHGPDTLLWGHGARDYPRACGTWVVQGHIPLQSPALSRRHISIDTGAFSTGRLTAAHISEGSLAFAAA